MAPRPSAPVTRVGPLELFLDLIFVFSITQITQVVVHPHGGAEYFRAGAVLYLTVYIYLGYTWLSTNTPGDGAAYRLLMFLGMFGFLVMALSVPTVFAAGGWSFAAGYLLVTLIHAALFVHVQNSSARAILRVAPVNLVACLLLVAAAALPPMWRPLPWAVAMLLTVQVLLSGRGDFQFSPAHFTERHGLVIIIALGESIVAIGVGAAGLPLTAPLLTAAALALILAAELWWSYFNRDGQQAEHALEAAGPATRVKMAALGFGFGHIVMIAGIVTLAAGIKVLVAHPLGPAEPAAAVNLAAGLGVYLLGDVLFRWTLGLGLGRARLTAALLSLASIPLGLGAGGLPQLGVLAGLLLWLLLMEGRR